MRMLIATLRDLLDLRLICSSSKIGKFVLYKTSLLFRRTRESVVSQKLHSRRVQLCSRTEVWTNTSIDPSMMIASKASSRVHAGSSTV